MILLDLTGTSFDGGDDDSELVADMNAALVKKQAPLSEKRSRTGVKCPICQRSFPDEQHLNIHLDKDGCGGDDAHVTAKPKPHVNVIQHRSKVLYNEMSAAQLRELCRKDGISDKGNKDELSKRHRRYLQLLNAEADSSSPASIAAIRNKLVEEESCRMHGDTINYETLKTDEGKAKYEQEHATHFEELIAKGRKTRSKSAASAAPDDDECRKKQRCVVLDDDDIQQLQAKPDGH